MNKKPNALLKLNSITEWELAFKDRISKQLPRTLSRRMKLKTDWFLRGMELSALAVESNEFVLSIWKNVLRLKEENWKAGMSGDPMLGNNEWLLNHARPFMKEISSKMVKSEMSKLWERFSSIQTEILISLHKGETEKEFFIPEDGSKSVRNPGISDEWREYLRQNGRSYKVVDTRGELKPTDAFVMWFGAFGNQRRVFLPSPFKPFVQQHMGAISLSSPFNIARMYQYAFTEDNIPTQFGVSLLTSLQYKNVWANATNEIELKRWSGETLVNEILKMAKYDKESATSALNLLTEVNPKLVMKNIEKFIGALGQQIEWKSFSANEIWKHIKCFDVFKERAGVIDKTAEFWINSSILKTWLTNDEKLSVLYTLFKDDKFESGAWSRRFPEVKKEVLKYMHEAPFRKSKDGVAFVGGMRQGQRFNSVTANKNFSWSNDDWINLVKEWCAERKSSASIYGLDSGSGGSIEFMNLWSMSDFIDICIAQNRSEIMREAINANPSVALTALMLENDLNLFKQSIIEPGKERFQELKAKALKQVVMTDPIWIKRMLNAVSGNDRELKEDGMDNRSITHCGNIRLSVGENKLNVAKVKLEKLLMESLFSINSSKRILAL